MVTKPLQKKLIYDTFPTTWPPSTTRLVPVVKPEALEAKNSIAFAISMDSAHLPIGNLAA